MQYASWTKQEREYKKGLEAERFGMPFALNVKK